MIETGRLRLRGWREDDLEPFAAIGRDCQVMRHLGGTISREQTADMIARQRAVEAAQGHCFWAIERRDDDALLGFCGLRVGGHTGTPVAEELEIGWRLRRDVWGQGYAREAAAASLAWGWANTARQRIAAWTLPANAQSWGLMLRLGMVHRPDLDFGHPAYPADHQLHRHVTYAIERPA